MQKLNDLRVGQYAQVLETPSHRILQPLGLREGKSVRLHAKSPLGGPLILEVDGRLLAVARRAASDIVVNGRCTREVPAADLALNGASQCR